MKKLFTLNRQGLSKDRGFSLIESLISMAIISFGLVFVVSIFPLVARNIHQNEIENIAFFLATAKAEELIAYDYSNLEEGVVVEDYGEISFYADYKRVISVKCFHPKRECENEETGMKRVDVEVFHRQFTKRVANITSLITQR